MLKFKYYILVFFCLMLFFSCSSSTDMEGIKEEETKEEEIEEEETKEEDVKNIYEGDVLTITNGMNFSDINKVLNRLDIYFTKKKDLL